MDQNQSSKPSYSELPDDEILQLYRQGDDAALDFLIDKYKSLVRLKARTYFIIGADRDDIAQEGMIGLFKAIRDYKPNSGASFHSFAAMCITRQIITAIKAASRQKHMPLNSYVSFSKPVSDNDDTQETLLEKLVSNNPSNPEELFISMEDKLFIESSIAKILSTFELQVLSLYLSGNSYNEIASSLSQNTKAVENALGRVRRKVSKIVERI